jgi:pilus assembly protein Flp/PilA
MIEQIFNQTKGFLFRFMLGREEEAQGLIEYALIVLLVAIVVIVVLSLIGGEVNGVFESILNGLTPSSN